MTSSVHTIEDAGQRVRDIFTSGINGTTYFTLYQDDKRYKIRVSDHSANYRNNNSRGEYDDYFSFVTQKNNQRGYGKGNTLNEWILNEDGDFTEEFYDVEACLEWHIN